MAGIFPNSGVIAANALNTVDVETDNCATELFHSTSRCTPRFDPAAANAVMSELLNTVALATGVTYDCAKLDNLATAITQLINDQLIGCLPDTTVFEPVTAIDGQSVLGVSVVDGCRQITELPQAAVLANQNLIIQNFLESCMPLTLPDASDECGDVTQLVLLQDPTGCYRLATYNPDAPASASGGWGDIATHQAPNQNNLRLPAEFADPTGYYTLAGIRAAEAGVGVDEAQVTNSRLYALNFTNDCLRAYELDTFLNITNSADANEAYNRRASLTYRYSTDGGTTWTYSRNGAGQISTFTQFNGINTTHESTTNIVLPVGTIDLEVIYLAEQVGAAVEPVIITANTSTAGVKTPRGSLRPRV